MNPLFFLATEVNSEIIGHIPNGDMEVDSNWSLINVGNSDAYTGSHYITTSFYAPGSSTASRQLDAGGWGVGIISDQYPLDASQKYLYTMQVYPDQSSGYYQEYIGDETWVKWGADAESIVFSGDILKVGPVGEGYPYTNIESAVSVATSGDMIQLYPTDWTVQGSDDGYIAYDISSGTFTFDKDLIFRGMGSRYTAGVLVAIRGYDNLASGQAGFKFIGSFDNIIFENLTIDGAINARNLIDTSSCHADANIHFNRNQIRANWQGGVFDLEFYLGNLYLQNCLIVPGGKIGAGGMWSYYRLGKNTEVSTISVLKCLQWFGESKCTDCERGPDPNDWLGNEASEPGYGMQYGEMWIKYKASLIVEPEGWERQCNVQIKDGAGSTIYDVTHKLLTSQWSQIDFIYTESTGGNDGQIQFYHAESSTEIEADIYNRTYYIDDVKIYAVNCETQQIYPNWDYKKKQQRVMSKHRSKTGQMFQYEWSRFSKFEFTLDYLASSKAKQINSWWQSSADLLFMINSFGVMEVNSVTFDNKSEPFEKMQRPYAEYYSGKIKLSGTAGL